MKFPSISPQKPIRTASGGIAKADIIQRLQRLFSTRGQPALQLGEIVHPVVVTHDATDPATADDPVFWSIGSDVTPGAGRFATVVLQNRAVRATVDGIIVSASALCIINVLRIVSAAAQSRSAIVCNRIIGQAGSQPVAQMGAVETDIAAFVTGFQMAVIEVLAATSFLIPMPPVRLGRATDSSTFDALQIACSVANTVLHVTAWGREFSD